MQMLTFRKASRSLPTHTGTLVHLFHGWPSSRAASYIFELLIVGGFSFFALISTYHCRYPLTGPRENRHDRQKIKWALRTSPSLFKWRFSSIIYNLFLLIISTLFHLPSHQIPLWRRMQGIEPVAVATSVVDLDPKGSEHYWWKK